MDDSPEVDPAEADHAAAEGALGRQADTNRGLAVEDRNKLFKKLAAQDSSLQAIEAALVVAEAAARRFVISIALTLLIIVLIGVVVVGYLHSDARAEDQRARIVALQTQLASCTIPKGECYQAETQRKAAATAAAAACAQTLTGYAPILACVQKATAPK